MRFPHIDTVSSFLAVMIYAFPETIDTAKWSVISESSPRAQIHLFLPESTTLVIE